MIMFCYKFLLFVLIDIFFSMCRYQINRVRRMELNNLLYFHFQKILFSFFYVHYFFFLWFNLSLFWKLFLSFSSLKLYITLLAFGLDSLKPYRLNFKFSKLFDLIKNFWNYLYIKYIKKRFFLWNLY